MVLASDLVLRWDICSRSAGEKNAGERLCSFENPGVKVGARILWRLNRN